LRLTGKPEAKRFDSLSLCCLLNGENANDLLLLKCSGKADREFGRILVTAVQVRVKAMAGVKAAPAKVRAFCAEVIEAAGVPAADAAIVAANLVEAELRGLSSHGVSRLNSYFDKLQNGSVNPAPDIKIIKDSDATTLIDADFAMGAVAGSMAMSLCLKKARKRGASFTAVCR